MIKQKKYSLLIVLFISLLFCVSQEIYCANKKTFTLIIDPGHGGKDPGALGAKGREKDINLKIALLTGELIESKHSDVKIVYTRSTDKYVTLQERPNIANKNDGDFFISIHTNASESKNVYGAETYTVGLSKSNANLEVAKRENAVMLLEDNNNEVYQGFDPNSPDSYIMFEFMQSKYTDQSVELGYYIQKGFAGLKRFDRGVRQAGFWVLYQVKMPSVLIELGFISNPNEETYLLSKNGQASLSNAIANAFDKYKHEYDKRTTSSYASSTMQSNVDDTKKEKSEDSVKSENSKVNTKTPKLEKTTKANHDIKFRVQVFVTKEKLAENHYELKRINKFSPIKVTKEGIWYKYTCGNVDNHPDAVKLLKEIKKLHKDAFLVAFENEKKISVDNALNKINK